MIKYHIPVGVKPVITQRRSFLSTPSGGKIAIDRTLLALWQEADGHTAKEVVMHLSSHSTQPEQILAALACLTEASLLTRQGSQLPELIRDSVRPSLTHPGEREALVSAIMVSHNSQLWLEKCLSSLLTQTYSSLEIIVIDNGSSDGSANLIAEAFPSIRLVSLNQPQTLARALNLGIETAEGEYYLLLNPDIELVPDALANMVTVAHGNSLCAAVVPKLRFTWAPAFLNGLGNFVGAFSWGTDCALGHLDLGQFDEWYEVPSACFAATLIPSVVFKKVGPIDEDFPLYYEDSEWSYRARLLGYSILAAPMAIVYHAFGRHLPGDDQIRITQTKLRQVSFGRLRFVTKLFGRKYLLRFLSCYLAEDFFRAGLALLRGNWGMVLAFLSAWNDYFRSLPTLMQSHNHIQAHRKCSDDDILRLQRKVPMPLIWHGLPCLTWNIVCHLYLPLLISGQTREVPEITTRARLDESVDKVDVSIAPSLSRALQVWRVEGFHASLYWLGRAIQWYLIQP